MCVVVCCGSRARATKPVREPRLPWTEKALRRRIPRENANGRGLVRDLPAAEIGTMRAEGRDPGARPDGAPGRGACDGEAAQGTIPVLLVRGTDPGAPGEIAAVPGKAGHGQVFTREARP